MHANRATAMTLFDGGFAPRSVLALVPENLETLLTGIIAQLRSLPDFAPECRYDAIATIEIARAAGLLKPRPPRLTLCTSAEAR